MICHRGPVTFFVNPDLMAWSFWVYYMCTTDVTGFDIILYKQRCGTEKFVFSGGLKTTAHKARQYGHFLTQ